MNRIGVKIYKDKSLPDWEAELGLKKGTIRARLRKGWSLKRATSEKKVVYKGFSYDPIRGKYVASLKKKGKWKFIGRYDTAEEAIQAKKFFINH